MSKTMRFMESGSYLLKNLHLLDPQAGLDRQGHLLMENGLLTSILDDEALANLLEFNISPTRFARPDGGSWLHRFARSLR